MSRAHAFFTSQLNFATPNDFRHDVKRCVSVAERSNSRSFRKMFNKKPRRNFRQRKDESSDEEDEQKDNNVSGEPEKSVPVVNKLLRLAPNRGITCSSKRESTPPKQQSSDEEGGETLEQAKDIEEQNEEKNEINEKTNSTLSFSDDKEGILFCFQSNVYV